MVCFCFYFLAVCVRVSTSCVFSSFLLTFSLLAFLFFLAANVFLFLRVRVSTSLQPMFVSLLLCSFCVRVMFCFCLCIHSESLSVSQFRVSTSLRSTFVSLLSFLSLFFLCFICFLFTASFFIFFNRIVIKLMSSLNLFGENFNFIKVNLRYLRI